MATSIRETALSRFFGLLEGMAGVTVARTPDFNFKPEELPAVAQYTGGHVVVRRNTLGTTRLIRIKLDCGVAASAPSDLEPAVNDLHSTIVAALMADPTLGGLVDGAIRETEMTDPDFDDENGKPNSRFTLVYEIELTTSETDPTSQTLS